MTPPQPTALVSWRDEKAAALIDSIERVLLSDQVNPVEPLIDVLIDGLASGARAWSVQKAVRDHFLDKAFKKLEEDYPGRGVCMLRREIDRYLIRKRALSSVRDEVQRNLAIAHAFKPLSTGTSESNLYDILNVPKKRPVTGINAS